MQIKLNSGENIYLRNFVKIPNRLLIEICGPTEREFFTYQFNKDADSIHKFTRKEIRLLLLLFLLKEDYRASDNPQEEDDKGYTLCVNARILGELLKTEKRHIIKALDALQEKGFLTYSSSFSRLFSNKDNYVIEMEKAWLKGSTTNYTEFDCESLKMVLNLKGNEDRFVLPDNSTGEKDNIKPKKLTIGKNDIKLYLRFVMDNSINKSTMKINNIKNRVSHHWNYRKKIAEHVEKLSCLFEIKFTEKEIFYRINKSARKSKETYKMSARQKITKVINDLFNPSDSDIVEKQYTTESKNMIAKKYKSASVTAIDKLTNVSLIVGYHNIKTAIITTLEEYEARKNEVQLLEELPALASTIAYSLFYNGMLAK